MAPLLCVVVSPCSGASLVVASLSVGAVILTRVCFAVLRQDHTISGEGWFVPPGEAERQDVAYQLGLPVDGLPVSGCLTDFEKFMEEDRPAWEWFEELFGELPPQNKVKQFTVYFTWFHERFRVLPDDATEDTIRIYARAYIIMLFFTQLSGDKSGNRVHLRKEERVIQLRLALDRLGDQDIVWEPYASLDVMAVVHLEILTEEHSRLWRACTSLIYFAVIEWHQVDRVLPQLGGVQHEPEPTSNIDWLHAKDGRGGNRWFPSYYQVWHLSWQNRFNAVLNSLIADPRVEEISQDVVQRGSSQAPPRVPMPHVPDNRRVEQRRCVGTRATDQEWRWLDDMIQNDRSSGDGVGHGDHRVRRGRPQRRSGSSGGTSAGLSDRSEGPPYFHHQSPQDQPQLHVDLNEPAGSPYDTWLGMGGMPASAYGTGSHIEPPAQQRQRPTRVRRAARCGTGSHILSAFGHDSADEDEDRQRP
ncbi:hypothetical protein AHAS_Ahas11G0248900 [Arachis hypogaea]